MLKRLSPLLASLLLVNVAVTETAADDAALDLFKQRITPILNSPNPSSCTECHLSGVDLKNYIGKTQQQTFASLRSAGLINVEKPDQSKLLQFIQRAPSKPTPVSRKARQQEFEAFRAWIRAAVKDPQLAAAKASDDQLGLTVSVEVIRHTRQGRVIQSFVENIWLEMGRCVSCHSPELNRNKIGRNGKTKEDIDAISWVVPRNPAATLQKLVDSGNIDTDAPDESLVLTKPAGLEEHGGGPKFAVGSRTDKNFRRFLNDYAAIVNGKYEQAEQLPKPAAEVSVLTGQHLRIVDLPERLGRKLLRVDIFRKTANGWSKDRWATAENPIVGRRKMWQSMVVAVAPRESTRAKTLKPEQPLPPGQYLVKIYVDRHDKLKKNRDAELGAADFYGAVQIRGAWKVGSKPPKIVHAPARD